MPPRPCLDCGNLTNTTRCEPCRKIEANQRAARRGTTAQRGLSGQHAAISNHYKQHDLPCVICGQHGTPTNPITAGHIISRDHGGPSTQTNYQPECRLCNSRKGPGRQGGP